jgi:hypothetical protein
MHRVYKFNRICRNSVGSMVADFLKLGAVHTKFSAVHLKFSIKIGFDRVRFFTPLPHRIFKHCTEHCSICSHALRPYLTQLISQFLHRNKL